MLHHRNVGGIEHSFQPVAVVEPLGETQDVEVVVRRGPHNELGALTGRGEPGGVAVFYQLLFALPVPDLDLTHRSQDRLFGFVRRQGFQS